MLPRRTRHRLVGSLVLVIVSAACTGPASDADAPTSIAPTPAQNATEAPLLPTDVATLPDATPETYDELLTQLRGTPVVVNIWGSWCDPCRREAAHLAAAARAYGDQVQFLGVDIMDTKASARSFIEEFDWPYPSIYDPSPSGSIRSSLGYLGQPVTIFYDADGNKVADYEGAIAPDRLDAEVQAIVPKA